MTQHTHYDNYPEPDALPIKDVEVFIHPSGMMATHDYSCPCCREHKAVLNLSVGIMQPCRKCQSTYAIVKKPTNKFKLFLLKHIFNMERW